MFFSDIANLCQLLEKENSRIEKKKILSTFFLSHSTSNIKTAINFLSLSLDNTDGIFQINEISIIKYIAEYLKIPLEQAQNDIKKIGDIGLYYYEKTHKNITNTSKILLDEIIQSLIILQNIKGKNSQAEKKIKLFEIFDLLDPSNICYIIRFITQSLRIGLSPKTIIEALHETLMKNNNTMLSKNKLFTLYAIYNDIGDIAQLILDNNIEELLFIQPKIGNFIQPQAAEVYIKEKKLINLTHNKYVTQIKLDGFRLQIHIENNFIKLFSRNGLIVNEMFPEIIDSIKKYTQNNTIINAIFDGEIIGFDHQNNQYLPFSQIAQRKRKHNINNNNNLCKTRFVLFDILFYNNSSCLDKNYQDRLSIINQFNSNNEITTIKSDDIDNEEDIQNFYQEAIKHKQEGIMIKDLLSVYEPGRRTRTWLKYKEIQKNSIEDLIDVVILGYTTAKGNRKNRQQIGSILVGLYNEKKDIFETLAQVGTGCHTSIWNELEELINPLISNTCYNNVIINKKHTPDFFILPHVIISLKADKITISKEHSSGYSVRFPRVVKIRLDKNKYQTHCPLLTYND